MRAIYKIAVYASQKTNIIVLVKNCVDNRRRNDFVLKIIIKINVFIFRWRFFWERKKLSPLHVNFMSFSRRRRRSG